MRYLERQILLQIIDNRWREHLYEMDYLREGIHLRGFAQIDPLVAYKNEGFTMFHELMNSIWEEFARVIFHVEVNVEPADFEPEPEPARRSFSTRAAGPSSLPRSARPRGRRPRRTVAGGVAGAPGAVAGDGRATAAGGQAPRREPGHGGQGRPGEDRPQRSLLVRLRQEVQEVPRRLAAGGADASPRPSVQAFNDEDLDALVAVLDPEVELQTSRRDRDRSRGGAPVGDPQG